MGAGRPAQCAAIASVTKMSRAARLVAHSAICVLLLELRNLLLLERDERQQRTEKLPHWQ